MPEDKTFPMAGLTSVETPSEWRQGAAGRGNVTGIRDQLLSTLYKYLVYPLLS